MPANVPEQVLLFTENIVVWQVLQHKTIPSSALKFLLPEVQFSRNSSFVNFFPLRFQMSVSELQLIYWSELSFCHEMTRLKHFFMFILLHVSKQTKNVSHETMFCYTGKLFESMYFLDDCV